MLCSRAQRVRMALPRPSPGHWIDLGPMASDFIVVGGGIAGCTVASELARRGLKVTLFEQRELAAGASGRNMGLLLNQVEPEVVRVMRHSLDIYRELADGPVAFELRPCDQVLLARDSPQMQIAAAKAAEMSALGMRSERLDASAMREQMPQLSESIAGGYLLDGAFALSAEPATRAFAESARDAGAEIHVRTRVSALLTRAGRFEGVITDRGRMAADAVIVATGPWLNELLLHQPVSAARGWVMRSVRLPFRVPWVIEEMSWPDQDELGRLGRPPTLEEVAAGGYDHPAVQAFVLSQNPAGDAIIGTSVAASLREPLEGLDMPKRIAARALELAPGLRDVTITSSWFGMRPLTPDGMPLAGKTATEGVYVHGGHGSIGMMSAPAIARWLVQDILDGPADPELARYDPGRFV